LQQLLHLKPQCGGLVEKMKLLDLEMIEHVSSTFVFLALSQLKIKITVKVFYDKI
jgi:hypothetical protein